MEPSMVSLFVFIAMLCLIALKVPTGFAIGFATLVGYSVAGGSGPAFARLGMVCYEVVASFVLAPVVVFILMGELIIVSGMGDEIFEAVWRWVGRVPGSLGISSMVACAIFAALTGVSMAGAVAVGASAIPAMRQRGYNRGVAAGAMAAGGTLGILIPPSVTFILYGAVTTESIGTLFIAGILPGILLTFLYCLYFFILGKTRPDLVPVQRERSTLKEKLRSLRNLWMGLLLIVTIMGSIYSGIATPSEAAGAGALMTLLIGVGTRKLNLTKIWKCLTETALTSGLILIIVIGTMYFGIFLGQTGITSNVVQFITTLSVNRWVIMLGVNFFLILLGCFIDVVTIILLTMPLVYPAIVALGFDPIWFGVIVIINMEIGFITPPVGGNLFAIQGIAPDVPFLEIAKGAVPFLFMDALAMFILCLFPQIALWLPTHM